MDVFKEVGLEVKTKIVDRWKTMSETDKTHFVNQVSLALTVWGTDDEGRILVVDILKKMVSNGSSTLADFGLYIGDLFSKKFVTKDKKIRRAALIIEGYRIKHELPSEPHKDLNL